MKLIPKSTVDRWCLAIGFLSFSMMLFALAKGESTWAVPLGVFTAVFLLAAYVSPMEEFSNTSVDQYSVIIKSINVIETALSEVNRFLEEERTRVAETEATVNRLTDEKIRLEPLVQTNRETVDAILAAHSRRTAKQVWKERLFGFALGLFASLIASFIFQYFKR